MRFLPTLYVPVLFSLSCGPSPAPKTAAAPHQLDRAAYNFAAQAANVPFFWRADENNNKKIDPDELALLWGPSQLSRDMVIRDGKFDDGYARLEKNIFAQPADDARQALVRKELQGGRPTLIETDLRAASAEDKAIVQHIAEAARWLEKIHAKQLGSDVYEAQLGANDAVSRAMFYRNQGPFCVTPQLENDPNCSALAQKPKRLSGLYPLEVQTDAKFCDKLAKAPNAKELMEHFSTVVKGEKGLVALPYNKAYATESAEIAKALEAAAAAIGSPNEQAFKKYLLAAAQGFRTNDWEPANEAWAQMGGSPSKWYLRIAPDEVYYEPCAWKAGYAVSFAHINPDSKSWQEKLAPVKDEMEKALAKLAGAPYQARKVAFKLPDFIDIILNAGDSRNSHGATIGQSLPNWGPVAERGGRTVAMTNLYTDKDSQETLRSQMSSLYCKSTMARATTDAKPATMSTVLHEASHNLGPSHEYRVNGKKDVEIFSGPLASTMEELKAQTSALYFSEWLAAKKLLTAAEAEEAHVRDVAWAFGHISRGMYDGAGKPKNYSQLASIQLDWLRRKGALNWNADEMAANATDKGCFAIDFAKWKPAVDELATVVLGIKGRGDKAGADKLIANHVDAKDEWAKLREVITQRWLRAPKATFVYSLRW